MFVGKFRYLIQLLTGQDYKTKNQIDMAFSRLILLLRRKCLAFVDYRTEGQVDSMTNRRGE